MFITKKAIAVSNDTTIQTIAILPFTVSIDTNYLPNGITENAVIRISDINRFRFQRALHTLFIKKPKNYTVKFQDITITNDLLKQSGVIDALESFKYQQLCAVLGVDAILFGSVQIINKRLTESSNVIREITGVQVSSTIEIKVEATVYDSSGKKLWLETYSDHRSSSPEYLVSRLMKNPAQKFPFKR